MALLRFLALGLLAGALALLLGTPSWDDFERARFDELTELVLLQGSSAWVDGWPEAGDDDAESVGAMLAFCSGVVTIGVGLAILAVRWVPEPAWAIGARARNAPPSLDGAQDLLDRRRTRP